VLATRSSVVSLRPRRAADDAFISRLAEGVFTEYAPHAAGNTLSMARAGITWLAFRDDAPVGFVVARARAPGRAELAAIAVDEAARGLGIGNALLARLERELLQVGFAELTLHTAEANVSALELFLKRGFRVVQHLPRHYRGVFDACALRKRLLPPRG
jgi:ribosomal protein S18 acetylase RimI-like enzyme